MKKTSLLFVLFFTLFGKLIAQTEKDAYTESEPTWFGIDFSKSSFMGNFSQFAEAGEKSGYQIRNKYFPAWNDIVLAESKKYDLSGEYDKNSIGYDLTVVKERNKEVDPEKLFPTKSGDGVLTKEQVAGVVSHYKTGKKGVGILYVVESFDKLNERGLVWVNFFDTATGKVLITERFEGYPGGIGLKNYWARVILDVMEQSGKAYRKAAKKYK